ncbi:hypothetical protein GGI25_005119 [Coemansia spiralis]|uniref:Pacifastin domain-containing protein n=2 Tax=Coemansia TaxID=4863 RepID=A0A9W8KW04_9FUNG|nr:hypothetical protein BX070DRAFT_119795 [Coemansia spiralis]KAJ1988017.1 hypothetical protein EDC05_005531 [Coemansia umbellata]KAJ2619983.1 hypothetical protein GGI26_005381 [Coemansia sp. RSA 1358]KAJ2672410.1 hypothetical protein GGI25_005119 [Coemansia spiralis]
MVISNFLLGSLSFALTTYAMLLPSKSISTKLHPESNPIWFTRIPELLNSTHNTDYLYCQMAHSGRDRWTITDNETGEPECSSCFCLPGTQRVGCVKTACAPDFASKNTKLHRQLIKDSIEPM